MQKTEEELKKAAGLLKASPLEVFDRTEKILKQTRELEKEIEALKGNSRPRSPAI